MNNPIMRAKLKVDSITLTEYGQILNLTVKYSDNPEDNSYSKYTPVASASLTITNPALTDKFKPGQVFYVDFSEA
jgi:hypothetical protein